MDSLSLSISILVSKSFIAVDVADTASPAISNPLKSEVNCVRLLETIARLLSVEVMLVVKDCIAVDVAESANCKFATSDSRVVILEASVTNLSLSSFTRVTNPDIALELTSIPERSRDPKPVERVVTSSAIEVMSLS